MRFVETDEDGNFIREVKEAYINGYLFAERHMEDVWFGFTVVDDKLEAFVYPEHYPYVSQHYNVQHYLDLAVKCALQHDLFATSPEADDDAVILEK